MLKKSSKNLFKWCQVLYFQGAPPDYWQALFNSDVIVGSALSKLPFSSFVLSYLCCLSQGCVWGGPLLAPQH